MFLDIHLRTYVLSTCSNSGLWMVVFFFSSMLNSPTHQTLLILFLSKNANEGDCWSINIGIIHVKNKIHEVLQLLSQEMLQQAV